MIKNKKGFFFVFDVILGFTILIIGVVFFLSYYYRVPVSTQPQYYSQDILDFLTSTKLNEFSTQLTRDWINDGFVSEDAIVGEVLSYFCFRDDDYNYTKLMNNTIERIVPDSFSFEINVLHYNESKCLNYSKDIISREKSPQIVSSRSLIINLDKSFNINGPYVLEVLVW